MDDETDWRRQVLVGLGVLVAVGALIGAIVAVVSIKAADYAGIDGANPAANSGTAPWSEPTEDENPSPSQNSESVEPEPSDDEPSEPDKSDRTKEPRDDAITLVASPTSVSTYGRINLTGTFAGGAGTTLQVQRREGGQWVDFPTSATVNGGEFATYIETGRPGPNKFRVKAIGGSKTSNTVTVRVS